MWRLCRRGVYPQARMPAERDLASDALVFRSDPLSVLVVVHKHRK